MPKYKMIVLTNPVPGREAEFNDWYDNAHIAHVLAMDGFKSARRYPLAQMFSADTSYASAALYEIETDGLPALLEEMQKRAGTELMTLSDAMEPSMFAGVYAVADEDAG